LIAYERSLYFNALGLLTDNYEFAMDKVVVYAYSSNNCLHKKFRVLFFFWGGAGHAYFRDKYKWPTNGLVKLFDFPVSLNCYCRSMIQNAMHFFFVLNYLNGAIIVKIYVMLVVVHWKIPIGSLFVAK